MPNSIPPSSKIVIQRATRDGPARLADELDAHDLADADAGCGVAPMRRTLRPPSLWFTTSHSNTGDGLRGLVVGQRDERDRDAAA